MAAASSIVLLLLFSCMAIYLMSQLGLLVSQGHKLLHYAVVFHALASVWMLLRVAFWIMDIAELEGNQQFLSDLVFWLPHSAMFLTFATLTVFLLKVVTRRSWDSQRQRYLLIFGTTAAVNLMGTITLAALDTHYAAVGDAPAQDVVQNVESAVNSVLFCMLAVMFG